MDEAVEEILTIKLDQQIAKKKLNEAHSAKQNDDIWKIETEKSRGSFWAEIKIMAQQHMIGTTGHGIPKVAILC
jgi:hypothetical protein